MRKLLTLLISFLALSCAACQREHSLSASSTAVLDADGTVHARKATAEELADLEDIERRGAAVDKLFPRPTPPPGAELFRGVRVLAPASVELTDHRIARLDGVRCSTLGLNYLSRYLLSSGTSLIVEPTGAVQDRTVPADVWTVDHNGTAVIYMSPAEIAIPSGWCDPVRTPTARHADRYEALARAFSDERAQFPGNAR
jgi:hypothetical protein